MVNQVKSLRKVEQQAEYVLTYWLLTTKTSKGSQDPPDLNDQREGDSQAARQQDQTNLLQV